MHELSITQNILDIALKQAPNGDTKIKKISLKIGEFTFVDPECVRFYFEQISKDTIAESASLDIERLPLKVKCAGCGKENPLLKADEFICPDCGSNNVEITSGRELFVESIEVE